MIDDKILAETSLPTVLQDLVLDSADIDEFLDGIVKLAVETMSARGCEVLCGITLIRPRAKATVASSDEQALLLDEVQYSFDDGPCLRAAREGRTYVVRDFRDEERFGGYPAAIAEHGIRSARGLPLPLEGTAAAGLNLYSPQLDAFGDDDVAIAQDLAHQTSASLRLAVRIAHLADTGEQLAAAMTSRTTIDVAAGIIMGQNRCSQDTAIRILKAASNGRNMKLSEVAASVVASIGQPLPASHFDR